MNNKKHIINLETFRDMLHVCPRVPGQSFDELPFEAEILEFLRFLGHSDEIRTLTDVNVNKLFQSWRSFGAVINKCLTEKSFGFNSFRLSQDFVYQIEHKKQKKGIEMYYPRFTKVIVHQFMSKDLSIPRRKKVNWHYVRDDNIFLTIKVVSRHQNTQQYGAILPIELTNEDIRNTMAYKEYYACATGVAAPKPKASARKKRGDSDTSLTPPIATPTPITTAAHEPRISAAVAKGKQPAKAKSSSDLSKAARTEAEQLKIVLKRSKQETHISQHGGSSTDEGTDVDAQDEGDKNDESDDEATKSDREREDEEIREQEEESFDPIPRTPEDDEDDGNSDEDQGLRISEEEKRQMNFIVTSILTREGDYKQTNPFIDVVSAIPDEQQNLYKALVEAYDADKTILDTYGESTILKLRREDDDQEGPSAGSDRGSKRQREGGDHASASTLSETATRSTGRSTTGSQSRQLSASESAFAKEPMQTTCQMEEPSHPVFETGAEDQPIVQTSQHPEWFSQPRRPPTPDRDWNKTLPAAQGNAQSWISELARQTNARSSFNELLYTLIDFSNFIMNRLDIDTFTLELLAGPTYELIRGSCNSLTELEYHLEEVYKATTDQLDWVNPEGQKYPHNLLQLLPLIPDSQGRRVIPFEHFINNDLEYLWGGASSRKYTTSVTKTKAADYGHIKWIEDLVPRAMWIQEPINYDRHALWGVSHWGQKRQQFYGLAINQESALDVYSKRRIIAVTELKIVEWHNYKHLDWISKRLNLTKPDTYRSDLKRCEAYTAYSNPRGFIYQNKDKKNRLIRIDELYKFSDGMLNDVRNALDDRLKGIRMQYLPTIIWKRGDKDRAAVMIQAIDKMLKIRRIMRSL
nr:hypothetical protein [Tanacetum cinerariifolium]